MRVRINDGGRQEQGYKGEAHDCVVRAIAIAMQLSYSWVYNDLHKANKDYKATRRTKVARHMKTSPSSGNYKAVYHDYILSKGWEWTPTMKIGTGCNVHLREGEVPTHGRIICRLSKHLTAVIDGEIHDTHDPSRNGWRCVYGYYREAS